MKPPLIKPHYRHHNGAWRQVALQHKPHLRLRTNGQLQLVRPASRPTALSDTQMKAFILRHYGSLKRFATRWRLSVYAVATALSLPGGRYSGDARHVRLLLGMQSLPTARSGAVAFAKATRRRLPPSLR